MLCLRVGEDFVTVGSYHAHLPVAAVRCIKSFGIHPRLNSLQCFDNLGTAIFRVYAVDEYTLLQAPTHRWFVSLGQYINQ